MAHGEPCRLLALSLAATIRLRKTKSASLAAHHVDPERGSLSKEKERTKTVFLRNTVFVLSFFFAF